MSGSWEALGRGDLLRFASQAEGNGRADEVLQRLVARRIVFEEIDGATLVSLELGVEKSLGIGKSRPVVKGQLGFAFVDPTDAENTVALPHRRAHPLPRLDHLGINSEDGRAKVSQLGTAPVGEFRDVGIDFFAGVHKTTLPSVGTPHDDVRLAPRTSSRSQRLHFTFGAGGEDTAAGLGE